MTLISCARLFDPYNLEVLSKQYPFVVQSEYFSFVLRYDASTFIGCLRKDFEVEYQNRTVNVKVLEVEGRLRVNSIKILFSLGASISLDRYFRNNIPVELREMGLMKLISDEIKLFNL